MLDDARCEGPVNVDWSTVIVGIAGPAIAVVGVWLSKRSDRQHRQVEASIATQTGVLGGYEGLTTALTERITQLESRFEVVERRAVRAEHALARAQLVITLLVAQIRDLGAEPDLPSHLTDDLPTDP